MASLSGVFYSRETALLHEAVQPMVVHTEEVSIPHNEEDDG
jgi:hypothetical protein